MPYSKEAKAKRAKRKNDLMRKQQIAKNERDEKRGHKKLLKSSRRLIKRAEAILATDTCKVGKDTELIEISADDVDTLLAPAVQAPETPVDAASTVVKEEVPA